MNEFLPFTEEEIKKFGGGKGGSRDKLRLKNPLPAIDKRIKFYDYVVLDENERPHPEIAFDVRGKFVDKTYELPKDWRVVNHKYFVDDIMLRESLTSFIKRYHSEFDEEAQSLRCSQTNNPNSLYFGMSQEKVKQFWEDNRVNGTLMHEYIELFYNDMFDETDQRYKNPAFARFLKYQREFVIANRLIPFRTELRNFDVADCAVRDQMCGSADMIYIREEDVGHKERGKNVVIVDYKFLGEMPLETYGRFCYAPFENMPDTKLYHYHIQLNGYQYMAERRTPLKVTNMLIVDFGAIHSKIDTYKIYEVPNLQDKIVTALKVRHEELIQNYVSKRKRETEEVFEEIESLRKDASETTEVSERLDKIAKKVKHLKYIEDGIQPIFHAMLRDRQKETRKGFDKPAQTRIQEFLVPTSKN